MCSHWFIPTLTPTRLGCPANDPKNLKIENYENALEGDSCPTHLLVE